MPKLTYFLRTSPTFLEESLLNRYDEIIHKSLIDILNVQIPESNLNQATLPVSKGGLGLRPALEVALSGFLSSINATEKLTNALLQTQNVQTKVHYESAIQKWKELSGLVTLPQNKIFQSEWDKGLYEQRYVNLLQNTHNDSDLFEPSMNCPK